MERGVTCDETQVKYLLELYRNGFSGVDSAREFQNRFGMPITPRTVIKIWEQYGMSAVRGGNRNGTSGYKFLQVYCFAFGDADLISKQSGLKLERVVEKCREFGLDFVKKKKPRRKVNYDYNFSVHPDSIRAGATRTDGYYCK